MSSNLIISTKSYSLQGDIADQKQFIYDDIADKSFAQWYFFSLSEAIIIRLTRKGKPSIIENPQAAIDKTIGGGLRNRQRIYV